MTGDVRMEKVALCLVWSLFVFLLYAYRYGMAARAIIALLAIVLIVQVVNAVLKINLFVIPYPVMQYFLGSLMGLFTPVLISAVFAYSVCTKRVFVQTHARVASAITLGACAMMVWIGLFDAVYPGIGWR